MFQSVSSLSNSQVDLPLSLEESSSNEPAPIKVNLGYPKGMNNNLPCRFISIRKSGTNLVSRLMERMNVQKSIYEPQLHVDRVNTNKLNPKRNYIISVRDPRDALVSLANWVYSPSEVVMRRRQGKFSKKECHKFRSMTTQQKVNYYLRAGTNPVFEQTLQAVQKFPRNVFIVRFEDLIGPSAGGSSRQMQLLTIGRIAKVLKYSLSREGQKRVAHEMIGGTTTYTSKKKKVGQWKSVFTAEDIKLVKEQFNEFILAFGYETDPDWDVPYLEKLEAAKEAI